MLFARLVIFIILIVCGFQADAHELVDLVTRLNQKVQMNVSCTPDDSFGFVKYKPADKARACRAIKDVSTSTSAHICTPFYKNDRPYWHDPSRKAGYETYATTGAVGKSRKQKLTEGFRIAKASEIGSLRAKYHKVREKMMSSCCKGDTQCETAFRAVPLEVCRDSKAEADPNHPDSCTLTKAFHRPTNTKAEYYRLLKLIYSSASPSDSALIQSVVQLSHSDVTQSITENNIATPRVPSPGKIVVTPYIKDGGSIIPDSTVTHELAHACSYVRRQTIAARGGPKGRLAALSLTSVVRQNKSCGLTSAAKAVYAEMLSDVSGGRSVASCLFENAEKSVQPDSYDYVANSCPSARLEEGFAIAREVIDADRPLVPSTFPDDVCVSNPSTKHPAGASVADCLFRHSTSIQREVRSELKCE